MMKKDLKARKQAEQALKQIGNLFNQYSITKGCLVNADGSLMVNASWATSDFIPVESSKQYYFTCVRSIAFYDSSKLYIGGSFVSYTTPRDNLMIRSPFNAAYVKVSSYTALMSDNCTFNVSAIFNPSKWVSKIWSALGDSITEQASWQPYVCETLGLSHYNFGVGGTKITDVSGSDKTAMCRDERINLLNANSYLITVMGGTNDWAQSVPIGTVSDSVTSTYYGALNKLCQKLLTKFPTVKIVLLAPPPAIKPNKAGWSDTTGIVNSVGLSLNDYSQAVLQIARKYSLPCIDLYSQVGWNQTNISNFVKNEGDFLHPTAVGGRRIAEIVIGTLKNHEPIL